MQPSPTSTAPAPCHLSPQDKKAFVGAVGQRLVQKHGKKKYYQPAEVRQASESLGYSVDLHCWAYCVFTTPDDFAALHAAAGEICDYAAMKAQVLTELAADGTFSMIDVDLSWLDWPDIDLSAAFDWF